MLPRESRHQLFMQAAKQTVARHIQTAHEPRDKCHAASDCVPYNTCPVMPRAASDDKNVQAAPTSLLDMSTARGVLAFTSDRISCHTDSRRF